MDTPASLDSTVQPNFAIIDEQNRRLVGQTNALHILSVIFGSICSIELVAFTIIAVIIYFLLMGFREKVLGDYRQIQLQQKESQAQLRKNIDLNVESTSGALASLFAIVQQDLARSGK